MLERPREIDAGYSDGFRQGEPDRREVEYANNARRNKPVCNLLRKLCRHCEDRHLDTAQRNDPRHVCDRADLVPRNIRADHIRAAVKDRDNPEAPVHELWICRERASQFSGSDNRYIPGLIGSKNLTQLIAKSVHLIPDARPPELAECRQILANLRSSQPQRRAELARTDCCKFRVAKRLKFPEVQAQAAGGRLGDSRPLNHA